MTEIAVVALHLQNEIIHPNGQTAKHGNAEQVTSRQVLQNAQRLLGRARLAEVPVIHVGIGALSGHPGVNTSEPLFQVPSRNSEMLQGVWESAFHDAVAPAPGEEALYHTGIFPLLGTGLQKLLDAYGVKKVMTFGVETRLIVQAAVFEISDYGYDAVVVEDCCAASCPNLHRQAIETLRLFATVVNSEQAIEMFHHIDT